MSKTTGDSMPTEAIAAAASVQYWDWCSKTLLSVVAMFLLGSMARTFVSSEPFDSKKFCGELIFSAIAAIAMYSMGLMQGMSEVQIVGFGAFASLGGVRTIEWALKIANNIKGTGMQNDR